MDPSLNPTSAEVSPTPPSFSAPTQAESIPVVTPIVRGPFSDSSSSDPPASTSSPPPTSSPVVELAFESFTEGDDGSTRKVPEMVLGEKELKENATWQEERIGRRLRTEYERMGLQLSELVTDNLNTPLRLSSIRILGATHTRSSFLSSLITPFLPSVSPSYFSTPTSAPPSSEQQTLRTLLQTTRDLTNLLEQHDMFKEISATLECATDGSLLAESGDVDLVLRVRERGRLMLKTSTDVGNGEGTASATARIRNTFGGAETLEANFALGTRTKSAFQIKLDTPVLGSPVTKADLSIFASQRDLTWFASCNEGSQGLQTRLRTTRPNGDYHELAYDAILRRVWGIAPAASLSVRDAAGPTVKSSLSYTFLRDTRDDPFLATKGSMFRYKQEYAGLGGDATFLKSEVESSVSRSLGSGYSLSLGFKSGLLYPLGEKPSLFSDRFHSGGPTSVRMFRPNTMGPKDSGDYIGGDLHWGAGLSLVAPLPIKPEWPVKSHYFLNAGRLTAGHQGSLLSNLKSLMSEPSITAGVGLVYASNIVRVEGSFGVPLAMGKQEGGVKGVQFGLGMSFL